MYGRVLLSVVLPFFLMAAGFGYALEVRQRRDVEDHATHVRQAVAPRPSPAVVVMQRSRSKVPVATSPWADEPDYPPVLLDSQQASDYTTGGGTGNPVNTTSDRARRQAANEWSDSASSIKPAGLIALDDDLNLLLATATELRPFRGDLHLPAPVTRPPSAAVPLGAEQKNTVPEPATGLLLAMGACALIRKRRVPMKTLGR